MKGTEFEIILVHTRLNPLFQYPQAIPTQDLSIYLSIREGKLFKMPLCSIPSQYGAHIRLIAFCLCEFFTVHPLHGCVSF